MKRDAMSVALALHHTLFWRNFRSYCGNFLPISTQPLYYMLVIATNNAHKLEEIRSVVGDKFKIVSLKTSTATKTSPKQPIP